MANDEYRRLGGGEAPKLAESSNTGVHFDILKNQFGKVCIRMLKDEELGKLSDEIIPLLDIYNRVSKYAGTNKFISAQPFKECFTKYTTNSPGFLAAVLRKLGLLKAYPNDPEKHLVKGYSEWKNFSDRMLATESKPYTK